MQLWGLGKKEVNKEVDAKKKGKNLPKRDDVILSHI